MGQDARIVVYAPNKATAENACTAAFNRMAELDSMMSDYRVNSELTHLSNSAGGPAVRVSPELFRVLKRSQEVSRASHGLFDVTVGPLVQLWRKARKTHSMPTRTDINHARKLVGWRKLKLDDKKQTVRLTSAGMRLDLGAIAKGYADDEVQIVLKAHGIKCALVEMGGDIVVSDPPPGETGWTIRVPNAGSDHTPVDMKFARCAVSTSGDTEQFVMLDGKKYSHVVNPLTGMAITDGVQSTVIAPNGLTSDSLSTALTLVPSADRARILKAYPGTRAYIKIVKLNTPE